MTTGTVAAVAGLLFVWAVLSGALARRNVTGPIVFAVAGYVIANPDWGWLPVDIETATVHAIAEITLGLLLFSDAARVNVRELRHDAALPVRLLAVGLPLSVVAGGLLAALMFDLPWALAAFVGAALAPTDAALSLPVINDTRIPMRLRRSLNVESGLNDGIATPIVGVTLAIAAGQLGLDAESVSLASALRELAVGVGIGLAAGILGALALNVAGRRSWIAAGGRRIASLALALGAFTATIAVDGNGFIAAFVAGAAFGAAADPELVDLERVTVLPELLGELMALVVWFLFGATLLPGAADHVDVALVVYALASLTVVRMVPVGLALLGTGLDRPTTAFLAWFGPRGLASVVFAILALEDLDPGSEAVDLAVAAVTVTVALSVVLHGATAGPGGRRYVQRERAEAGPAPRGRRTSLNLDGSG